MNLRQLLVACVLGASGIAQADSTTLTFTTTGKKEKHRIGATSFEAKSAWDGAVLRQEIEAVGGFKMTQVYYPATDGQTMFVSMTVEKPEFKPPIKPITRTYRRVN